MAAAVAAAALFGGAEAAGTTSSADTRTTASRGNVEVVVTLKAPPARTRATATARDADAARTRVERRLRAAIPQARVRWRYRLVLDGFAVVLPRTAVARLARVPGVDRVWPAVTYTQRLDRSPQLIGADKLWGAGLSTAGQGMKIGIIDDGIDATHPFFSPAGFSYPSGFPKGQTRYATPKVIVQRTFPPPGNRYANATLPFDPEASFHATHVAGIAAGDAATNAGGRTISGVAPMAYLGNYKALTTPTPGFGLDGNAAEIVAAIEAAVADGMDVINLSLGEPEVEPTRDIVVRAIDGAAAAGVVPVIAAGNDHDEFGDGSVSSPGNAAAAITVAATTKTAVIADFSSSGPTPVSLRLKPDVSAPGYQIFSSFPRRQGLYGPLSGTSMAAPHIAGAAALLQERHPAWTPAQIKSALVQTGDAVRGPSSAEVPPTREGGGLANLPRADAPLVFAAPTALSWGLVRPGAGSVSDRTVTLTDAGGGGGPWQVTLTQSQAHVGVSFTAPPTVTVPGSLRIQGAARAGTTSGEASGFVVLTRGSDVRRIPYFLGVSAPALGSERHLRLPRQGTYAGTTRGAPSRVRSYRYPTGGDLTYPGPERAYRVTVGNVANFGVAVTRGHVVPHVTFPGDENHLAGYTALPLFLNPYFEQYGSRRPIAAAVLPLRGSYDIVFDTPGGVAPGPFRFRYWVNDTTPPRVRVTSAQGRIKLALTDSGSGVDPQSLVAKLDGRRVSATYADGIATVGATPGRHRVELQVSDLQETKNTEDVARIKPNTATFVATVRVR